MLVDPKTAQAPRLALRHDPEQFVRRVVAQVRSVNPRLLHARLKLGDLRLQSRAERRADVDGVAAVIDRVDGWSLYGTAEQIRKESADEELTQALFAFSQSRYTPQRDLWQRLVGALQSALKGLLEERPQIIVIDALEYAPDAIFELIELWKNTLIGRGMLGKGSRYIESCVKI